MTQERIGGYKVQQGENVTIEVVATGVNEFVTASLDNSDLSEAGSAPARFPFTVTKDPGQEHLVDVECQFDATAANNAQYQIFVQGSGGGRFSDFTIPRSDLDPSRTITFVVV